MFNILAEIDADEPTENDEQGVSDPINDKGSDIEESENDDFEVDNGDSETKDVENDPCESFFFLVKQGETVEK